MQGYGRWDGGSLTLSNATRSSHRPRVFAGIKGRESETVSQELMAVQKLIAKEIDALSNPEHIKDAAVGDDFLA